MGKLTSIEYLRALSMLYIVGYWHLLDYTSISVRHAYFEHLITAAILALFVFGSGYLLGGKKSRQMSATQFYKRRLLRVYPLYVVAIVLFYVVDINNGWTSLKGLLFLSMYLPPAPLTLWFITMLMLFYLATPMLLAIIDNIPRYLAVTGAMILATLVLQVFQSTVDMRVVLYFPSFCAGLFCANHGFHSTWFDMRWLILGVLLSVPLCLVQTPFDIFNFLRVVPLVSLCAYLIFYVCYKNEHLFKKNRIIAFLSYSSFAMYLFHRPVYTFLTELFMPRQDYLQVGYLMTVCLGAVALLSWCLQKLYDLLYYSLRTHMYPALNV